MLSIHRPPTVLAVNRKVTTVQYLTIRISARSLSMLVAVSVVSDTTPKTDANLLLSREAMQWSEIFPCIAAILWATKRGWTINLAPKSVKARLLRSILDGVWSCCFFHTAMITSKFNKLVGTAQIGLKMMLESPHTWYRHLQWRFVCVRCS